MSVRTATANSLRGLLYEFGVVLRGGRKAGLKSLTEQRAASDEQLPATMRTLVDGQLRTLEHIGQRIDELESEIAALQKQLAGARELDRVPGIGVLGQTNGSRIPPRATMGSHQLVAAQQDRAAQR